MSRKKFKRADQVTWASKKQIRRFVDEVTAAWEAAGLTEDAVLKRVSTMLDDAHSGNLQLDEANVHVTGLAIALRQAGAPLPERSSRSGGEAKSEAASKYV